MWVRFIERKEETFTFLNYHGKIECAKLNVLDNVEFVSDL
jgi:hypothetical protein